MNMRKYRLAWIVTGLLIAFALLGQSAIAEPTSAPAAATVAGGYWSTFRYEYVAGATFTPRTSVVEWRYPGGGCIYAASNPLQILNVPLSLPQGSRIDYLRIFFYDTSADQSNAWITIYDGAGGFTDLTHVASTGTAGYGTALSPFVGHIVDNASHSYVLNWQPNVAGSSMQLCGLRVAYRLPFDGTFLPIVTKR